MSILVTMQVGPIDWAKFKSASDQMRDNVPSGMHSSRTYRKQDDPSQVIVIEEWDSHDAMHAFQEKVGDEFNRLAGTERMHWDVALWELADEMK